MRDWFQVLDPVDTVVMPASIGPYMIKFEAWRDGADKHEVSHPVSEPLATKAEVSTSAVARLC
jgi:hypothetical protein